MKENYYYLYSEKLHIERSIYNIVRLDMQATES